MQKSSFGQMLEEQGSLHLKLLKSLAHLPIEEQYRVLLGWLPLDVLRRMVPFLEEKALEDLT